MPEYAMKSVVVTTVVANSAEEAEEIMEKALLNLKCKVIKDVAEGDIDISDVIRLEE